MGCMGLVRARISGRSSGRPAGPCGHRRVMDAAVTLDSGPAACARVFAALCGQSVCRTAHSLLRDDYIVLVIV
jgi:hypothetical protein